MRHSPGPINNCHFTKQLARVQRYQFNLFAFDNFINTDMTAIDDERRVPSIAVAKQDFTLFQKSLLCAAALDKHGSTSLKF